MEDERKLLIVDDDPGIRKQLRWAFDDYTIYEAGNREEAIAAARREEPQVALLDLSMPPDLFSPKEGLAALDALLAFNGRMRVIVATGNDEHENAVRAIAQGAYDFCGKPVDIDILRLIVDRAFYLYELEQENKRLSALTSKSALDGFIAADPQLLKLCQSIAQVAGSDISVLFLGDSGTGKEVLARALHQLSHRQNAPFVAINCAAIPENLLESELFGHEKGSFTGAVKQKKGKFEEADSGTLFLDEIAEMSAPLQAKLLRFLQERIIERVGGQQSIEIDVRIVSATNRNLEEEMKKGSFREDLYYRINEISFDLPPLRERQGDALLLAKHFIQKHNKSLSTNITGLSADGATAVGTYDWPGNVRELENRVRRAMVLAEGKTLTARDLELEPTDETDLFQTLKQAREEAEAAIIRKALAATQSNISKAAKLLGVSRPTLYELMKSLGMND